MRCNQVLIVPEFSDVGKDGLIAGNTSQKDVVKTYCDTLVEYLDEDRVKFSVFREGDMIEPNSLILCLSAGWAKSTSKARMNTHEVYYSQKSSEVFAAAIADALGEWGRNYVDFHHKNSAPVKNDKNPFLAVENTIAAAICPFKLNGPNADDYVRWLPKLGQSLAHCIYEFLFSRGEQPRMMSANYR